MRTRNGELGATAKVRENVCPRRTAPASVSARDVPTLGVEPPLGGGVRLTRNANAPAS